jgi:putative FmdB family regulatory protein
MPLYEYKCRQCGEVFELIQKFSDSPLETHAKGCGGPVERLIGVPALQFKGSGWYITDYAKNKNASKTAGKNAESTSGTSTTTESSSKDSKSDSSSGSKNGNSTPAPATSGKK